ncbi:glycosyltransferase involved in cell wall biosynthesis [Chitinophaga skermanii]|uniref:Glycosyltransferase involved in cell wall biosynthesis n=1 Tax=Chitinophaga skermanii TaxID=331697 RepID=A0A327R1I4_9BACT|nr:glycosyltransferase [Chitinophaga skermanii]RAJ10520.1 glycosyltransferase involved in cell wall biosynthesis [Chitinophaga skermanii]
MKNILLITALPFRKQGNQSMMRFVKMFLSRGIAVEVFTSGNDQRGENAVMMDNFSLHRFSALRDKIYNVIRAFIRTLKNVVRKVKGEKVKVATENIPVTRKNYFTTIKSEDTFPPYGKHNITTLLNKWTFFILALVDNVWLTSYLLLFHRKSLKKADIIVGYENAYAFTAKFLARLYGKKYINKYQGVVPLKATNENISDCKRYYPLSYYGLNTSDLCFMVNDGTNGIFYAKARGCKNIYFEPHGVAVDDYKDIQEVDLSAYKDKFIIFNNASNSKLKRADRVIRPLLSLAPNILKQVIVISTYHAEDLEELRAFVKLSGLDANVVFLENLTHKQSNYLVRNTAVSFMTNEVSNLGNPMLEAIYYRTPVISLDDKSMDGFITNGVDGFLIPLNSEYDKTVADIITKLVTDKGYYQQIKDELSKNFTVNTLQVQQEKEFKSIVALFN